jgi:uncharacterized sodium:solute symporter family permease YidK
VGGESEEGGGEEGEGVGEWNVEVTVSLCWSFFCFLRGKTLGGGVTVSMVMENRYARRRRVLSSHLSMINFEISLLSMLSPTCTIYTQCDFNNMQNTCLWRYLMMISRRM